MMDPMTYAVLFVALSTLSTWLVAGAYKRTRNVLKHKSVAALASPCVSWWALFRISLKRESAVSKEVVAELNATSTGKKLSKAEKDER